MNLRPGCATVVRTPPELADARVALGGRVAVAMTMGALHEGHASLFRAARSVADSVIATIFVNPLQFGPAEDFDQYPRTLQSDRAVCQAEGVDLIFAPSARHMYPHGKPAITIDPGPLGDVLEGASRPGHFAGVLTVVTKLLNLTRPDVALFGEKDYQQLALIRAMVMDFDLPVEILGVPTVREPDGLALSSRNRYLDPANRRRAALLWRALSAGAAVAPSSGGSPEPVLGAANSIIESDNEIELDYLALTDPALRVVTGEPWFGQARLLLAARLGGTRLIDNVPVEMC